MDKFSNCHNMLCQFANSNFSVNHHFLLGELSTDVDSKQRRKLNSLISLQLQLVGENSFRGLLFKSNLCKEPSINFSKRSNKKELTNSTFYSYLFILFKSIAYTL